LFARDPVLVDLLTLSASRSGNRDKTIVAPSGAGENAMGKKIFVGNLPFTATSADLETLFSEAGTCESASVVTDRDTGRSRGFGFVEMSSSGEAEKAISTLNGRDLQGRQINVSEAKAREGGGGGGGGRRPRGGYSGPRGY
jgi:RNA recognition motif-containing protein